MLYTAKLRHEPSGFIADCIELDATGEGATRDDALDALRAELAERVGHVEGMVPPVDNPPLEIEIVVVDET
jgi:HD superfamily phosphodiesterase